MIDTESYPRAWEEAFARGCLSETVSRCKACEEPVCSHPDPIYSGVIPPSGGAAIAVATSPGRARPPLSVPPAGLCLTQHAGEA